MARPKPTPDVLLDRELRKVALRVLAKLDKYESATLDFRTDWESTMTSSRWGIRGTELKGTYIRRGVWEPVGVYTRGVTVEQLIADMRAMNPEPIQ